MPFTGAAGGSLSLPAPTAGFNSKAKPGHPQFCERSSSTPRPHTSFKINEPQGLRQPRCARPSRRRFSSPGMPGARALQPEPPPHRRPVRITEVSLRSCSCEKPQSWRPGCSGAPSARAEWRFCEPPRRDAAIALTAGRAASQQAHHSHFAPGLWAPKTPFGHAGAELSPQAEGSLCRQCHQPLEPPLPAGAGAPLAAGQEGRKGSDGVGDGGVAPAWGGVPHSPGVSVCAFPRGHRLAPTGPGGDRSAGATGCSPGPALRRSVPGACWWRVPHPRQPPTPSISRGPAAPS